MTAVREPAASAAARGVERQSPRGGLLARELRRLRLLIHRRILWLRPHWARDPLQSYRRMAISDAEAELLLADGDEGAERRFFADDAAAARLSAELHALDRDLAERRAALEEPRASPSLPRLARLFRLAPFERDVVLLCAAPDLDPAFERLFAYVQDDVERRRPTPALALALFAGDAASQAAARQSLGPAGTLRRARLVTLEASAAETTACLTRPLRIDERVVDFIRGSNRLDERLLAVLRPLESGPLTARLAELASATARWLAERAGEEGWLPVNLVSDHDAGAREVARAICECLALRACRVDHHGLARLQDLDREDPIPLIERESVLLQIGLYLEREPAPPTGGEERRHAFTMDALERLSCPLFVASPAPLWLERSALVVHVQRPTAHEQRALWRDALGSEQEVADGLDELIQQYDLGPGEIAAVAAGARRRRAVASSEAPGPLTLDDLWSVCRERTGAELRELAQRLDPRYDWDDLVLPPAVLRHLRELAGQAAHRAQVYEQMGFGEKLSRGRGISALFAGPSGTGKTMAAEVLARHVSLDLYRIDLSAVVDKYIGETEKRLRRVFDAAERSGVVLFFDEADALFGKRSEVKDSHDRYANIEIDYLLQRMEDYRGLAILATNRKGSLDRAFLRRLRFLVDFPFPDVDLRRRIWRSVFPKTVSVAELDFECLARLELAGGNIRNIALNAAFLAAGEGGGIAMRHVVNAAAREMVKFDKIVGPAEFGRYHGLLS